ncbi:MAG TPA: hypothetical protein VMY37_25270 [Thermoguttaceae bacterium]|nr:hypothetical protein [Thermoguttaceae bacterium]
MNPIDDNLHAPDDERFDLLADGELPEPERRRLLSGLDHVPGGWRRCALAFLEAQSWKEEMQSIRPESTAQARGARPIRRTGFPGGFFGTLVAMAASFILALGLGVAFQDIGRPGPELGPSRIEIAGGPQQPEASASKAVEPQIPPGPSAPPAAPDHAWQLVSVPVGTGPDGTQSIQVPAREGDRVDEQWMDRFAPTIPAELAEALKQQGRELRWSRQLVPFPLEDGQQLVVPLEQVELHYVGNPVYQ